MLDVLDEGSPILCRALAQSDPVIYCVNRYFLKNPTAQVELEPQQKLTDILRLISLFDLMSF